MAIHAEETPIQSIDAYINSVKKEFHRLFNVEYDYNKLSLQKGLPQHFLDEIMALNPLSVAIPTQFGGRGVKVSECLRMLSAASYESLSLSLMFGINIALFLEPLAKYGNTDIQERVFEDFLLNKAMGGLMITEPAFGSDALNMRTSYQASSEGYNIKGQKHWQGLTGDANYWLIAARRKSETGELMRDVDFIMTDNSIPSQKIQVSRIYNNLGLYAIPYGINDIDVQVPLNNRLTPESTGIKMMLDILHRSRLQFPGMAVGFIKRLLDETISHCAERQVSGAKLNEIDSVKFQLSRLQAAYTLASAMCAYSASTSSIQTDLATHSIDANSVKALVSDLMQESAQIALQLAGANGYRLDHIAGRGVVDSRPFQIFEGSNEMLYAQIAEGVLKAMKKAKETNLLTFLKQSSLTEYAASEFVHSLNFHLNDSIKQRHLVTLGRIIARVVCFQFVLKIYDKGFSDDMTSITRQHIDMDITMLKGQFSSGNNCSPQMSYQSCSDWIDFIF
ncbi:acyl-CoA dehydrogenase family protein [Pedobacter aquatilis]|uniref:acyl-CoA dehydrogenase family protein n=1 Tax=Pedobacter aquatilis TaxID=351343 RepID=UPI0029308F30|nr:acyl-CoA dehydrogenase family protein [Pedobacter aquatilis]